MGNELEGLRHIRSATGRPFSEGLPDETVARLVPRYPELARAIAAAEQELEQLQREFPKLIKLDEDAQIRAIQERFVNFYPEDAVNPYVPLAARGPWIVTVGGAVVHDNGGYGMLGLGHAPDSVLGAMSRPHVMANIMTGNYSQLRLTNALRREIGQSRDQCPFSHFIAMNSGSEAVTVAARISDVNAKLMTESGGRYEGRRICHLSLAGGFHGRTDRPARFSASSIPAYRQNLASFTETNDLWTVAPNDMAGLRELFAQAEREQVFLEAFFLEPVMGEGNPGQSISPEFYRLARQLTQQHGSLLLVDSIQAGLRAQGVLSIVDYPGFEGVDAPDIETYSKALNAGQFPLSILALNPHSAGLYRKGIYGNTMTANPRAMDVATAVLQSITPQIRENIRSRGTEVMEKLNRLASELNGPIRAVQGTGLLFSCELGPEYKVYGANSTEEYMRRHGVGVIHGGSHSLRYTPHFGVSSEEIDLILSVTRDALIKGPKYAASRQDTPRAVAH